jgi:hypothetical protein
LVAIAEKPTDWRSTCPEAKATTCLIARYMSAAGSSNTWPRLADGMLHIVLTYPGPDLDDLINGADQLAMEGVVVKHAPGRIGR